MRLAIFTMILLGACIPMPKQSITTDKAPQAIGPYSQAVEVDGFIFVSGQIPLDPATGELIQGDIQAQTERVLKNIEAILNSAGLTMDHICRTTVYMVDLNEFTKMNDTYAGFFKMHPPARATIQVAALPKGARIEIDAVARR